MQRVSRAEVRIRSGDSSRVAGSIGRGFVVLAGFKDGDTAETVRWLADKVVGLRVFPDAGDKMNLSLGDIGGAVLIVSQFTLYGETERGRRPSFIAAARPEVAEPLYQLLIDAVRAHGVTVATGEFGASMDVELVNDGPVTLWLER